MNNKRHAVLFVGFATIDLINGKRYLGGAGGSMSLNAALLGMRASLLAPLSNDEDGRLYKSELTERGVDFHLCMPQGTGIPQCEVRDPHAPGSHRVWRPNGAEATIYQMKVTRNDLQDFDAVVLANAPKQLVDQIAEMFEGFLVYIPGPQIIGKTSLLSKPAFDKADIVFANEEEAQILTKETSKTLGKQIFVQTLGEHGGNVLHNHMETTFSAPLIDGPTEPTGAGDSFALGFTLGILNEDSIDVAIVQGKQLAQQVVGQTGSVLYSR